MARMSPYAFEDPGAGIEDQARQRQSMGRILWTVTAGALLASFLGYGFVAFSVTAWRRRELALQMAMGARRQEIWQQTLFEHLIAGTAASVLGLVIGLGAALLTSSVWDWPLVLEWGVGGGAMLFGTLAGALLGAAAGAQSASIAPALAAKAH